MNPERGSAGRRVPIGALLGPAGRVLRPRRDRRRERRPRYLGTDERILIETRQHPFAIVGAVGDAVLLIAPAVLIVWGASGVGLLRNPVGEWISRFVVLFMALVVARLVGRVLQWEFERVLVTNQKVIHVHGVLSRRIASTPLSKVSEFTVSQPLLGRLFDYGSLVVDVPGGREQALHGLSYLPDPSDLYRAITDRARGEEMAVGGGGRGQQSPLPPGSSTGSDTGEGGVSATLVIPPDRDE